MHLSIGVVIYIFFEYMRDKLSKIQNRLKQHRVFTKSSFFCCFFRVSGYTFYMNLENRLIGISAFAKSGKDTVCSLMNKRLIELGYRPVKFPFASELKKRIDPFLSKEMGISAFTKNPSEKDIIRPFLVLYGETAREIYEDYWVELVKHQIEMFDEAYAKDGARMFPVITDVRYENEAKMIQGKGGKILHIEREGVSAPNASEEKNHPIVRGMADLILEWPTFENEEDLSTKGYELVKKTLKDLIDE